MQTQGRHLVLDIWYHTFAEDVFFERLGTLVDRTFQVVKTAHYRFTPHGQTSVYILSESHVAVHSYPEHSYVSVDIYICNPAYDLTAVAEHICEIFPAMHSRLRVLERGEYVHAPVDQIIHASREALCPIPARLQRAGE